MPHWLSGSWILESPRGLQTTKGKLWRDFALPNRSESVIEHCLMYHKPVGESLVVKGAFKVLCRGPKESLPMLSISFAHWLIS